MIRGFGPGCPSADDEAITLGQANASVGRWPWSGSG